jgi:hypothetical protein
VVDRRPGGGRGGRGRGQGRAACTGTGEHLTCRAASLTERRTMAGRAVVARRRVGGRHGMEGGGRAARRRATSGRQWARRMADEPQGLSGRCCSR